MNRRATRSRIITTTILAVSGSILISGCVTDAKEPKKIDHISERDRVETTGESTADRLERKQNKGF